MEDVTSTSRSSTKNQLKNTHQSSGADSAMGRDNTQRGNGIHQASTRLLAEQTAGNQWRNRNPIRTMQSNINRGTTIQDRENMRASEREHTAGRTAKKGATPTTAATTTTETGSTTQSGQETQERRRPRRRKFIKPGSAIVNLSNHQLSQPEISLLDKGLNFIPTPPREHPAKILQDLLLFDRRIKLHNFFFGSDNRIQEQQPLHPLIKPSSGWTPQSGLEPHIDIFKENIIHDTMRELKRPPKHMRYNLTKEERAAIKTLKNNKEIVIKPADKGGKIVIQNRADYIKECERQLNNQDHYRILGEDPTTRFNTKIIQTLKEAYYKDIITWDLSENLIVKNPTTATFYTLPKIHKKNNPGRPIVSGIGTITEKISCYVDETIKDLSKLVPSYVKDTTHFLNIIETITVQESDIMCTVDVSALYTNIPHDEGVNNLEEWMRRNNINENKIWLTKKLSHHILNKNYFEFNKRIYHQKMGTAMGTRFAPNYAIIFMGILEEEMLAQAPVKPKLWKRFIDDIFMIWTEGETKLQEFLTFLNNFHPTIKFTSESSQTQLAFLDTLVIKEENRLITKVYHKPTDFKQYLHFKSDHPFYMKRSIPYSLLIRAKRICTKQEDYQQEANSIIEKLKLRVTPTTS